MISQSIAVVVIPAGVSPDGRLRANIYLTPRLSGAQLLSDFPDWLDWTHLVQRHGLTFTLACEHATATVAADTAPLRPDIWRAVFGHDSLVERYSAPDLTQRLIVSYPSRDAHDFLRGAYQFAATASGARSARVLAELLRPFAFRDEEGQSTLDQTLAAQRVELWGSQHPEPGSHTISLMIPGRPSLASGGPDTRTLAERFALYHHLPPAPGRPPLPSKPAELARLIDFHQALTSLASYPGLVPALGLVFPVELPASFCPPSPSANNYLLIQATGLQPGWTWAVAPTVGTPFTAYVRGPVQFAAAPVTSPDALAAGSIEPADIIDGFLALTPSDFHLVGVDLDGAMLKIMALADSLANAERLDGPETKLADGLLPSLRSGGVSLLADGRALQLLKAIQDNQGFETDVSGGLPVVLFARDLTRGYRIDIEADAAPGWRSLHRRDGTYRFGDGGVAVQTEDEEGLIQLAVAQPADDPTRQPDPVATAAGVPQPGTDLYLNERIARWNGWSLSAPRPGLPLNRSPNPAHALDTDPTAGQPVTTFAMTSSFAVHPGSLPALRFGTRYRARARAVDVAGHSVALEAAVPDHLAAPADGQFLAYYRYEPVGPPVLVLRAVPGPGGSLAELAIRSFNADPSLDAVPTPDADERHVAPPRAAVVMVEHHGMLDDAAGRLRGDAATYQMIVERDRGQIPVSGNDPLEPAPQLTVPYFPDPLARGAAFTSLPQTSPNTDGSVTAGGLTYSVLPEVDPRPYSVTHVPFGDGWPQREPFRIRLAEGTGPPSWDGASRVLTVRLAKGQSTTTAMSCYVHPGDLDLLGIWNWLRELFEQAEQADLQTADAGPALVLAAADRGEITRAVLDGGNEFITPSLPVRLIHAVQQPLGRPGWLRLPIVHDPGAVISTATLGNSFTPVTAWRSLGSHHAVLLGALQVNGATTAAIDLEARWIDWIDDVTQPGPATRRGSGHVERINLTTLDGSSLPADGAGGRMVAVYLPRIDALWFAAPFDELAGATSPTQVAAPLHHLGDTKHRMIRYRAVASSRFQEYFPEPGTLTSRIGAGLTVDVPSSARPLPPDIAYVVPAFGWDRQVSTNTKTEVRRGSTLRVYLRRPWYSSGPAELLGVVTWPAGAPPPTDDQREANKALITQWGLDPIWDSGPLSAIPTAWAFPAATRSAAGLTLHETSQPVDVAGHDVGYDPGRRLWYCDIELSAGTDDAGAYAPFVRLALARYQPHSITGVELSQVALADFAQLTPDRSAALTIDPADPRMARLVVAGPAPVGPTSSYITATVEARRPDVHTDLGWEPAAPSQVRVIEDSPAPSESGSVLYAASVKFTHRPPPGQFRLVVREFEVVQTDPLPTTASGQPQYGARLVYASILLFDYPLEVS